MLAVSVALIVVALLALVTWQGRESPPDCVSHSQTASRRQVTGSETGTSSLSSTNGSGVPGGNLAYPQPCMCGMQEWTCLTYPNRRRPRLIPSAMDFVVKNGLGPLATTSSGMPNRFLLILRRIGWPPSSRSYRSRHRWWSCVGKRSSAFLNNLLRSGRSAYGQPRSCYSELVNVWVGWFPARPLSNGLAMKQTSPLRPS